MNILIAVLQLMIANPSPAEAKARTFDCHKKNRETISLKDIEDARLKVSDDGKEIIASTRMYYGQWSPISKGKRVKGNYDDVDYILYDFPSLWISLNTGAKIKVSKGIVKGFHNGSITIVPRYESVNKSIMQCHGY